MKPITFLMIRLGIGLSILGHGLIRIPKLAAFSEGMTQSFEGSYLPMTLVKPFSMVLPFVEFTIGLMVLIGLFTRIGAIAGSVLMLVLIFGTSMIENWGALPSQMIHLLFFAMVYECIQSNAYSLDHFINKPSREK